jgi:hypothetical protein
MKPVVERLDCRSLALAYFHAKRTVIAAGYEGEIAWQEDACDTPLTETRFLVEAAWVVLSSGMREAVIRRIFPDVTRAFANFVSARAAATSAVDGGRDQAFRIFRHAGKIEAIVAIVLHVDHFGFDYVQRHLRLDGLIYLQTLPYIGPVTAFHLAKNLGHDVAKPDRHLVRIAHACGYDNPHALCSDLRAYIGEPVPVIDIVLWRFATLSGAYVDELVREATSLLVSEPAETEPTASRRWLPSRIETCPT